MNNATQRRAVFATLALLLLTAVPAAAQAIDENCTVSVLNRTVQVLPNGSWVLPNIPTNVGLVRARVTCVENGITRSGQSEYFRVPPSGVIYVPPMILNAPVQPIAASIVLTSPVSLLTSVGATVQVTATASYPGGGRADVSGAAFGTNWFTSNPRVATISADGLVTAVSSGTVLVSAMNEGALGILQLGIVTSGDGDNDGLPDQFELDNGLDPNNPGDASGDLDGDGLSNLDEYRRGTELRIADTDGDGLADGAEVARNANPLLPDTDGDGIRDGLEVQTGSDPTDAASYNLADALSNIEVAPLAATLIYNTIAGDAYTQLTVTGRLRDGTTINLTSTGRGTNYTSSNITVCNFGSPDGRVFAGVEGTCTVTASNGGHSADSAIIVRSFSPRPLSALTIAGHANSVDVKNNYAFVAAGSTGLKIVNVENPLAPVLVATRDTPGNANDVRVVGNYAYVADGGSGLSIIDVTNPVAPAIVGTAAVGTANDVVVANNVAYIAGGSNGLVIVNVATPGAPILVGSVHTPSAARGVDVTGTYATVVDDSGYRVIDVSNPSAPQIVGNVSLSGAPNDVRNAGRLSYVASYTGGMQIVDFNTATAPRVAGSLPGSAPSGFIPFEIAPAGPFAIAAEVLSVNATPIVDITDPAAPLVRGRIDFQTLGDYNGNGIAVAGAYVYMTGSSGLTDRGSSGTTRLFIGQYLPLEDHAGNPPQVTITSPAPGTTEIEGQGITIVAEASDDVGVSAVTFTIDGAAVFTDTSMPFEYAFTLPAGGARTLALGAIATDLGGNVGTAVPVPLNVIPDPLTTVTGTVIDVNGAPISGASVTTNGDRTGTSAANGTFAIAGVPTVRGDIVVAARAIAPNGDVLTGSSGTFAPVRGGTTQVGSVLATPATFETNYGTFITTCDDCAFQRTLPFPFPFYGTTRTVGYVGTNGYITFSFGDSTYTESLPAFSTQPRISAFFDDLIAGGGMWINDQLPGRFVVTYVNNRHFTEGGSNTLQMTLFADGRIQYAYRGITALRTGSIVGLTPGPNSPPQQVNYSAAPLFDVPAGTAVFEYFTNTSPFDLDFGFVIFIPRPEGGYQVRTILQPPPGEAVLITNDAATQSLTGRLTTASNGNGNGKFARAEVEVRSSRDPNFRAMVNTDKDGLFTVKKVPVGGVTVTVRRKDQILGYGAIVIGDGASSQVQRIDIAPPAPEKTEPQP
jgi:hypothetical protein